MSQPNNQPEQPAAKRPRLAPPSTQRPPSQQSPPYKQGPAYSFTRKLPLRHDSAIESHVLQPLALQRPVPQARTGLSASERVGEHQSPRPGIESALRQHHSMQVPNMQPQMEQLHVQQPQIQQPPHVQQQAHVQQPAPGQQPQIPQAPMQQTPTQHTSAQRARAQQFHDQQRRVQQPRVQQPRVQQPQTQQSQTQIPNVPHLQIQHPPAQQPPHPQVPDTSPASFSNSTALNDIDLLWHLNNLLNTVTAALHAYLSLQPLAHAVHEGDITYATPNKHNYLLSMKAQARMLQDLVPNVNIVSRQLQQSSLHPKIAPFPSYQCLLEGVTAFRAVMVDLPQQVKVPAGHGWGTVVPLPTPEAVAKLRTGTKRLADLGQGDASTGKPGWNECWHAVDGVLNEHARG